MQTNNSFPTEISVYAHLENHAQYTCLRIAEAFATELKLFDRWVVGLELGYWYATELLQRLALLLSNTTLPNESTHISS